MLSPGFIIRNDTIWPLQISLRQVGPLYFDVIQPGQSFVRDTGAVWFTVHAAIFLDEKDRITDWDAVTPVAIIAGGMLLSVVTAGAATFAAGGLAVAAAISSVALSATAITAQSVISTVTAASALDGAGFSKTAVLVINGEVVEAGKTLSAAGKAAFDDIFKRENISLTSLGCYAGPPWPFRREVTPLRITGGPTFRRVPGKDQVEFVAGSLHIDTQPPPAAYGIFTMQTATGLPPTNADYRFMLAHNRDLVAIKTGNTGTGSSEIHVLTAASGYKNFAMQTKTALPLADANWDFGIAPNDDVFAICKNNNGSGTTEIHILSAAHNYRKFVAQVKSALGPTDHTWAFAIAHNRDVVAIKKSGTGSNTTELHILSAEHAYQVFVTQTKTALPMTDDKWSFDIAHNRDVFAFMKNGTGSGTCELHILAASTNYQAFAIQTKTALHEIDPTWSLHVAENRDVFAIRKNGGASKSTEVHVMNA